MRASFVALLCLSFAISAVAQPSISEIDPVDGFTYGPTNVTITGAGFTEGAVEVLFGGVPATILNVTPTTLRVYAQPTAQPGGVREEGPVDVTVRVAGHGEATVPNGFYFHPLATGGPADYVMTLVPLSAVQVSGAHGSRWTAELRVFNASHLTLRMLGPEEVFQSPPIDPAVQIEPHQTEQVILSNGGNGVDGAFLYVPSLLSWAPKFSLRVRDISQNAASLGTEIPVVGYYQAGTDVMLVDIPTDPRYRATLRIYAFTPAPMRVGVAVYPESGNTPIEQYDVNLHGIDTNFEPFPANPAYIAVDPLTAIVRASGPRVRVELTNYGHNVSPPPPPIWGFVSITNNETQQVTAVTPR
jgi:hypothetical protein